MRKSARIASGDLYTGHRPFHLYLELFGVNIWVSYAVKKDEVRAAADYFLEGVEFTTNPEDDSQNGGFLCCDDIHWIWTGDTSCELLAHECIHAAAAIMRSRYIDVNMATEEVLAYLTQWLMTSIRKKARANRRRKGEK